MDSCSFSKRNSVVLLVILFAWIGSFDFAKGQDIPPLLEEEIRRRVDNKISPSVSIGVWSPEGGKRFYNYGNPGLNSGKKPDSLTLYEIGSVTKTFTAILVQMHLGHELDLPLSEVFPEIKNPQLSKVSIWDLLHHISGYPRLTSLFDPQDWSDPYQDYSDSLLMRELEYTVPDSVRKWSYSNFGYTVLGKVLEKRTGKPYHVLITELLDQAIMMNTAMDHGSVEKVQTIAKASLCGVQSPYWHFGGASRYAGALISSTHDLLEYVRFMYRIHTLFDESFIYDAVPTGLSNFGENALSFKAGWLIFNADDSTQVLCHNGGTGGFASFVGFNKRTETAVVVLANSNNHIDDIGMKLLYPSFPISQPKRSIAYELAAAIKSDRSSDLKALNDSLKRQGVNQNIMDVYWLERMYFGQGNYHASFQLAGILVQELPEDWEVHFILGQNLEQLGRLKESTVAYKRALVLKPGDLGVERALSRLEKRKR